MLQGSGLQFQLAGTFPWSLLSRCVSGLSCTYQDGILLFSAFLQLGLCKSHTLCIGDDVSFLNGYRRQFCGSVVADVELSLLPRWQGFVPFMQEPCLSALCTHLLNVMFIQYSQVHRITHHSSGKPFLSVLRRCTMQLYLVKSVASLRPSCKHSLTQALALVSDSDIEKCMC